MATSVLQLDKLTATRKRNESVASDSRLFVWQPLQFLSLPMCSRVSHSLRIQRQTGIRSQRLFWRPIQAPTAEPTTASLCGSISAIGENKLFFARFTPIRICRSAKCWFGRRVRPSGSSRPTHQMQQHPHKWKQLFIGLRCPRVDVLTPSLRTKSSYRGSTHTKSFSEPTTIAFPHMLCPHPTTGPHGNRVGVRPRSPDDRQADWFLPCRCGLRFKFDIGSAESNLIRSCKRWNAACSTTSLKAECLQAIPTTCRFKVVGLRCEGVTRKT